MASDLTLNVDGGYVNIRVGAIIIKDGKFLMTGNDKESYLYSVGGRIRFGETAEQAVMREVKEETGVDMKVDRLAFVHENFFTGDFGVTVGKPIYEISLFFTMIVPDDFSPICESQNDDGAHEKLVWVSADTAQKIYPEFFRTELSKPLAAGVVKHIVTRQ